MQDQFIDVHTFDGRLKNNYTGKRYDITTKKKYFNLLLQQLTDNIAIETMIIMMRDMDIENGSNYQIENNTDASDVLTDILHKDYKDLLPLIQEQLRDVRMLGLCPSGRVTRLLQIWLTLL